MHVLISDILYRYTDNEFVSQDDLCWINKDFKGDRSLIIKEIIRLETQFVKEALKSYYSQLLLKQIP